MNEQIIQMILKQKYLYRGTNDHAFNFRKEGLGGKLYSGIGKKEKPITFTSLNPLLAMFSGIQRINSDYSYYGIKTEPLLLAINPINYMEHLKEGSEPEEIEVHENLSLNDVFVVDSPEKFEEFCTVNLGEKYKEPYARFFREMYLKEPQVISKSA